MIIGNTVNDFYNDFIAVSGIDGVSKDAVKSAAKQNQNALQRIMSVLAEIFAPLIKSKAARVSTTKADALVAFFAFFI